MKLPGGAEKRALLVDPSSPRRGSASGASDSASATPRRSPPSDLMRIDVCWTVADGPGNRRHHPGLRLSRPASSSWLSARASPPASRGRSRSRWAYSATGGGRTRRRTEKLRQEMAPLVTRIGQPHAIGFATWASGFALYLEGRWKNAQELLEKAEGILRERCTGVAWELDNAQFYSLRSLVFMGRFEELSRRLPSYLRDAQTARRPLRRDQPQDARLLPRAPRAGQAGEGPAGDPRDARALVAQGLPPAALLRPLRAGGDRPLRRERQGGVGEGRLGLAGVPAVARCGGPSSSTWSRRTCARAPIVAAVAIGEAPERALGLAERDARRIEREAMPWSNPLAELIRASVAALRGDTQSRGRAPRLRRDRLRSRRRRPLRRRGSRPARRAPRRGRRREAAGGGGSLDVEGAHREPRAHLHAHRPRPVERAPLLLIASGQRGVFTKRDMLNERPTTSPPGGFPFSLPPHTPHRTRRRLRVQRAPRCL